MNAAYKFLFLRLPLLDTFINWIRLVTFSAYPATDSVGLSPWKKPRVAQILKKFPTIYGTRCFITVFTTAHHSPLSWARWIQFIPSNPVSIRSVLILCTHLRLSLLVVYSLLAFRALRAFFSSPCFLHALPISFCFSWSDFAKSRSYEPPHYVLFTYLLLFHLP
jgi:hypothetical protein